MNSAGILYAFALIRSFCGITVVIPTQSLHYTHSVEPVTQDFNTCDVQHKHSRAIKMSRVPVTHAEQQEGNRTSKGKKYSSASISAVPADPGVVLWLYIYISKDEFTLCKVVKPHWHLRNSSTSHRCHTQLTDISNSPLSIGRPS